MNPNSQLLRQIPKIDDLLRREEITAATQSYSHTVVVESLRETIEALRQAILAGEENISVEAAPLCAQAIALMEEKSAMNLRPVINATGIILHTNLGRARLSDHAVQAIASIAQDYNTLEYNLKKGSRGSRYDHVEELVSKITGAEDAMVVNNNAAAVMLVLSTMAKGKEVIVSRGELVEIGGAFRVPDIMAQSGGALVEVGTTNKTHPSDYTKAITENTGALLKVHTSNFKIMGFMEEVSLAEMVEIGHNAGLPVLYDLGSGALIRLEDYGILDEPNVQDSVKAGADIISFSGDKLMGGPQAGIIIGKKQYIDAMKKNPLTRAFRIDKLTLAALEATLRDYLEPAQAMATIPTLQMIAATPETLRPKAEKLLALLEENPQGYTVELCEDVGQIGGGSVPTQMIPSIVIALKTTEISLDTLEQRLRKAPLPIIARISKERMLFDVRTINEKQFPYINEILRKNCVK